MSFINKYSHCVSLLITGFILYIAGFDLEATSCHARLSTIGTVLLMSESLLVLTPDNVWSQNIPDYRTRSHLHWMLQITGTIMNIIGAIIMIKDKKDDTISLHAIFGLLSILSMIFLCLSGATLFYTVKFKKLIHPVVFKFFHTYVGIFAFVFAIFAQCLGYDKKWVKTVVGRQIATLFFILTCTSALICILRPSKSLKKYFKAIIRSF